MYKPLPTHISSIIYLYPFLSPSLNIIANFSDMYVTISEYVPKIRLSFVNDFDKNGAITPPENHAIAVPVRKSEYTLFRLGGFFLIPA